jgi:hypothetical protein
MKKDKKDIKVQIRMTVDEKKLLEKLVATNKELTISKILRDSIKEKCEKLGIKLEDIDIVNNGNVGSFTIS